MKKAVKRKRHDLNRTTIRGTLKRITVVFSRSTI
jgi:hypothetical protein